MQKNFELTVLGDFSASMAVLFMNFATRDIAPKRHIVREPAILLIRWLRPKRLKVCSYVEKYAEFKNQTLKKIDWYTKVLISQISTEMGYPIPQNLI